MLAFSWINPSHILVLPESVISIVLIDLQYLSIASFKVGRKTEIIANTARATNIRITLLKLKLRLKLLIRSKKKIMLAVTIAVREYVKETTIRQKKRKRILIRLIKSGEIAIVKHNTIPKYTLLPKTDPIPTPRPDLISIASEVGPIIPNLMAVRNSGKNISTNPRRIHIKPTMNATNRSRCGSKYSWKFKPNRKRKRYIMLNLIADIASSETPKVKK
ncbi:MAG: hypothetical protein GYA55_02340 [SAR324 cluster bacterium]|uniref:Uncharacterized protein n=1 Tax=SAR324 cluster bacterium TaxID=2024889 RepID=A0A7X9FPJ4_9DELT|nr:hypothetical protein [SAR324 cluster bacterium]